MHFTVTDDDTLGILESTYILIRELLSKLVEFHAAFGQVCLSHPLSN